MKTRPRPSLSDFQPQLSLDGRRVNVDTAGRRIAVRVANFGETHSGFGPEVKVPRNANLDAAHVGTADLADGSSLRVATMPMNTTHASPNLAALHAAAWYENSGLGVARGRYSTDEHGIRFDGLLFDDIDDAKIDRIVAASASGDWRSAVALKSFGDFEHAAADFVGSCIVNVGGYSDTYRPGAGQRLSLVASAAGDYISIEEAEGGDMQWDGKDRRKKKLTAGADDSNPDGAAALPEGCAGECSGCSCNTGVVEAPEGAVVITAAALSNLLEVAMSGGVSDGHGVECGDQEDAYAEAQHALVAGGFRPAPDPVADRLAALEQTVIDLTFQGD